MSSSPSPFLPGLAAKRILVTGARGRLAACLIPVLRTAGCDVRLFSRTGGEGCLPWDALWSGSHLAEADGILHLAWSTFPATAESAADDAPAVDLALLERLLTHWSRGANRPQLVFFSSAGTVYGPTGADAANEETPCRPISRYGRTKLMAEQMITRCAAGGLPATILRVSNPYGFNQLTQRAQGIIPHAFHCAQTGRPLSLWGDGSAQKDFLHSADFLRAVGLVLAGQLTGTYNIAHGQSHRISEVIAEIEAITGRSIAVETSPPRSWDVHDVLLDNTKFRQAAGWAPATDLRAGLQLTHQELSRTS